MPTDWEYDVARIYVNYRKITRPKTDIRAAIISFLIFAIVTGILTWFTRFVLISVGALAYLPLNIQVFFTEKPALSGFVTCLLVICVELIFSLKYIVIGIIRLYQHYAPEVIRRRCLFKPTCSEYAILAVRKYGAIIGLFKSWYRLVYLCRGNIYRIHYPWYKLSDDD